MPNPTRPVSPRPTPTPTRISPLLKSIVVIQAVIIVVLVALFIILSL